MKPYLVSMEVWTAADWRVNDKAQHVGEDESVEVQRLFEKLSVALMRGNCALLNNRGSRQFSQLINVIFRFGSKLSKKYAFPFQNLLTP